MKRLVSVLRRCPRHDNHAASESYGNGYPMRVFVSEIPDPKKRQECEYYREQVPHLIPASSRHVSAVVPKVTIPVWVFPALVRVVVNVRHQVARG